MQEEFQASKDIEAGSVGGGEDTGNDYRTVAAASEEGISEDAKLASSVSVTSVEEKTNHKGISEAEEDDDDDEASGKKTNGGEVDDDGPPSGGEEAVGADDDRPEPSAPPAESPAKSPGNRRSFSSCRSSISSLNSEVCKICHCGGEDGKLPLITPCLCCGTLKFVHKECLQRWIKNSDITKCELCKFPYIMQSKTKPFSQWERLEMTSLEKKKLFCSFTFHIIALVSVVWSLYILIERTGMFSGKPAGRKSSRTSIEVKTGDIMWPFWTKLFVVAIGFTGGVAFMYIQCKVYVQLYKRWKAFNRIIEIQEPLLSRKVFNCQA